MKDLDLEARAERVGVWLQSRFIPARGRVGLEVHRCLRKNKGDLRISYT
jgi:hypothetical protein